jgi:hypothetical protein
MTLSTLLTALVSLGIVWGGFIVFMIIAITRERAK